MTIQSSSANKKLFLSAVSSEFESYRQLLAGDLKRPALDVAVQEDFVVSGGSTLQKLDDYIKACHGVVHLIGKATGAFPEVVAVQSLLVQYPDFVERLPVLTDSLKEPDPGFSYTQWEAYLAIYHKRAIFIYRPNDFELKDLTCPREARFVYDAAQEKSQQEHFSRICALGRDRGLFLTQERLSSAVLRDLVEILPQLEPRIGVPPSKLRHTAEVLIGRDEELTMLDEAWNDPRKNVVVVRGKGGEGKTSLVASWMAELAMKDWRGAERVFDWSFYSQGTRDQSTASAETFIVAALTFFGDADPNRGAFEERGTRLAQLVGSRRGLLVLDGLEPLQYPPGPMQGQLTDKGMAALLRGLAGRNVGLCIVTTREKVDEIKQHYGKAAIDHALEFLSPVAGAALLHYAGAKRAGEKRIAVHDKELQQASVEVRGHALTLFLVGQYLRLTENGDIRRRDRMKLADAEAEYKNDANRPYGHAFKAIEAYENWFAAGDEQAKRQLAILRLLGLFDRPASKGCLKALRAKPKISGLSDALVSGSDKDWNIALTRLQEINLVGVKDDHSVDCHPLFREYFAVQLKEKKPKAWQAGHKRLYQYLCESTKEGAKPTLEELQPLYQAVSHGCHANLHHDVTEEILPRIFHGSDFYSTKRLGAYGAEVAALASFFDEPWVRLSPLLRDQAWILSIVAFDLHALGRLHEALQPMRTSVEIMVNRGDWINAPTNASNLSELELTLGQISSAMRDAENSIRFAEKSSDAFQPVYSHARIAEVLHQSGRRAEALEHLQEAERIQASLDVRFPFLYSMRGFFYCDLILAQSEQAAWLAFLHDPLQRTQSQRLRAEAVQRLTLKCFEVQRRAKETLTYGAGSLSSLSYGLDNLTLARVAHYLTIFKTLLHKPNASVEMAYDFYLGAAVDNLRRAGAQHWLVSGLLTRAWLCPPKGNNSSRRDLDEAWEIAERGPMRLHMADIHLYRARLFHAVKPYPWNKFDDGSEGRGPKDDLDAAEKLIKDCGYHRRDEELADAREAAKNWD